MNKKLIITALCLSAMTPMMAQNITGKVMNTKGVGNGISLIIMIGIIARLPQAFVQEVTSRLQAISIAARLVLS